MSISTKFCTITSISTFSWLI